MEISLTKRNLTDQEITKLIKEIKKFPNLVAGNKKRWKDLDEVYVATLNKKLVGACGTSTFINWLKIGPFVVLEKYHGKGYGKKIIESVVNDNKDKNLFTVSSNPVVWKIMKNISFQQVNSFWELPPIAIVLLTLNIMRRLTIDTIQEQLSKRNLQKESHHYFIRRTTTQ